jgi:membrane associated rhomboid family serine protease
MIPFRDHNRSSTFPVLTVALIAVNVIVWLYEFMLDMSGQLEPFIMGFAFIPNNLWSVPLWWVVTIFTAMFMHGSWAHIIGNMMYLWIFGDNVEDRLGKPLFLLFYFGGGIAATLAQMAVDPFSTIPNLGASGAIAGVLGGYLLLFPQARVDTLVVNRIVALPALYVLGFWFIMQLFSGVGSLGVQTGGGVAYFAHIGGFVAGAAMMWLYKALFGEPPQRRQLGA